MITVFTTKTCAYCQMVKQYLTLKGKEFDVVDLEENPEQHQEIIQKTGAMTVPIVRVEKDGSEEFVVGFNRQRLAEVI